MRYVLLVIAALIAGCPLRDPVPVPIDPPYPASAAAEACENLRRLGCPEGFGSVTGATCERALATASELRPLPVVCWAQARDTASAKGCGSLRCIR